MMKLQSIRGMNDLYGDEIHQWRFIENLLHELCDQFCYYEIRTPFLEHTSLFQRGVGESSDIVEKEMYSFEDRSGDKLSLRPEGTAGVVRAFIQHHWLRENPISKVFYYGPMFRHERPQKGRFRQFYQFGLEIIGSSLPRSDIEIISLQNLIFNKLGLTKIELRISSVGCSKCRNNYKDKLLNEITFYVSHLCNDCQRRKDKNPIRILDCKNEQCKEISLRLPVQIDHLCSDCTTHFDKVKNGLSNLGINFLIDKRIVRGLDYYTRTAFEFVSHEIGSQGTVCGGGRYDGLFECLGGPPIPGVGCAMGIERLLLLSSHLKQISKPILSIIPVNDSNFNHANLLAYELRKEGFIIDIDLSDRSLKNQMKRANKLEIPYVLMLGEDEINSQIFTFKNMITSEQKKVTLNELKEILLPFSKGKNHCSSN